MTLRATAVAAGVAVAMLAAGCGGSGDAASDAAALTVALSPSGVGEARVERLRCAPPGGAVPDPADACAALAAMDDPFAAVPASTACAEIYGGPQVIEVRGTWAGPPVDARFSRVDACEIERYDRLVGALGIAAPGP